MLQHSTEWNFDQGILSFHRHAVLLCPVVREMRQQVWPADSGQSDEGEAPLVLDDLLDRWELEVEPLLGEAALQDARLARRAKRKAQRGSTREAMQDRVDGFGECVCERNGLKFPPKNMKPCECLGAIYNSEVYAALEERGGAVWERFESAKKAVDRNRGGHIFGTQDEKETKPLGQPPTETFPKTPPRTPTGTPPKTPIETPRKTAETPAGTGPDKASQERKEDAKSISKTPTGTPPKTPIETPRMTPETPAGTATEKALEEQKEDATDFSKTASGTPIGMPLKTPTETPRKTPETPAGTAPDKASEERKEDAKSISKTPTGTPAKTPTETPRKTPGTPAGTATDKASEEDAKGIPKTPTGTPTKTPAGTAPDKASVERKEDAKSILKTASGTPIGTPPKTPTETASKTQPKGQAHRERPAVWASAKSALEVLEHPVRTVSSFMSEVVSETAEQIAAAVPAVIARAVIDWHFKGPLAELEQLENWWESARQALESRPELWDRLVQDEGIFLRRIDRGVDALRAARQIYLSHANFGVDLDTSGSGWPTQTLDLLSDAAAEMTSRLRPVRDSAAWRVVDAAKAIEKELSQANVRQETWSTSERDAIHLIIKVLSGKADAGALDGDRVNVLMDRVAKLMTLLQTLRETFVKDNLAKVLDDLLRAVVSLREELSVSDCAEAVEDCVQQWYTLGEQCNAGSRMEEAVAASPALRKDVNLRQALATLRGLHVLLQHADLRARLLNEDGYESSESQQVQGRPTHEVCHPPSPARAEQSHSPRGGYAPRRQRFKADDSETAGYSVTSSPAPVAPFEVPGQVPEPMVPLPQGVESRSRRSRPSTAGRPSTPSWLRPPWQRSDTPLASWTRPDTPSTVCDDAEAANLPRWKVVDGQYVPLKSSSSGRFLPPLQRAL
eukprot:s912_g25.t2